MRNAIDLNHQPSVQAIEVHTNPAAWVLPAKLYSLRLAAKQAPKQHFW
jgi:hypothetical protein